MQAFIDMATQQLGIDQTTAQQATGGLLGAAQQQLGGGEFDQLLDQLPGAKLFFNQFGPGGADAVAPDSTGGLGGMLGGLAGALGGGNAGSALGGIAGALGGNSGLAGAATALLSSGLSGDQIGSLAEMFIGYVKENAGDLLGEKMAGFLPQLAKFAS